MSKLRVALGVTPLWRAKTRSVGDGLSTYARTLWRELPKHDCEVVPFGFPDLIGRQKEPSGGVQLPLIYLASALLSTVGLAAPGGRRLARQCDVIHATDHRIPRVRQVPTVATIHDCIPIVHPEWESSAWRSRLVPRIFAHAARVADHVITGSTHSASDIEYYLGIPGERITVIPHGVDEEFFNLATPEHASAVLKSHGLRPGFLLAVGTLQPRKNILRVINAFSRLPIEMQNEHPLIVVGRAGWRCEDIIARLQDLEHRGIGKWMKYVSPLHLPTFYQQSSALLMLSLYEGFGLPVLEAFASGCPVIAANATSLPEVAADGALLVDPTSEEAISEALKLLLSTPMMQDQLRLAGVARARCFSWFDSARRTADVYRSLAN